MELISVGKYFTVTTTFYFGFTRIEDSRVTQHHVRVGQKLYLNHLVKTISLRFHQCRISMPQELARALEIEICFVKTSHNPALSQFFPAQFCFQNPRAIQFFCFSTPLEGQHMQYSYYRFYFIYLCYQNKITVEF